MYIEPVNEEKFYGRENLLDLLGKRVASFKDGYRQNLAILGTKFLGKTSVIFKFIKHFNESKILPIYIEIRNETFASFAYRFMAGLLYYYSNKIKTSDSECSFEDLKEKTKKFAPETSSMIVKIEEYIKNRRNIDQIYHLLLELPPIFQKETEKLIVFIIDEFHLLENFQIRHPFSKLGKEIMTQKSIMYILISSKINKAKVILSEKLSLLFGKFEIVSLEPFSVNETKNFLNSRITPCRIADKYTTFLAWVTGGIPFYLDLFASELKKYSKLLEIKIINQDQIHSVFKSLLFDSKSILFQYFYSKLEDLFKQNEKAAFISLLLTLCSRNSRMSEIENLSGLPHRKDIQKYLTKLIELEIISKHSGFYKLPDRLFRIWFNLVYKNKLSSLYISNGAEKEIEKFDQQLKNMTNFFQQELKRDPFDKIISLFQSFRNESIIFNSRRRILPHFDTVETGMVGKLGPYLLAHKKNTSWICSIKKKKVEPEDILEFDTACKRTRRNIKRKIFIIIGTLDSNIRLLAKEKKFWVWELKQLNFLLDLYNQIPIIV